MIPKLEASLGLKARAVLRGIQSVSPSAPVDILKVFLFSPRYFGKPFCDLAQELMRGKTSRTGQ